MKSLVLSARAMTPNNIINAFKKTAIFPYDPHVFSDDDFLPSSVSERPFPSSVTTEESDNIAGPSQSLRKVNAVANKDLSGTPMRLMIVEDLHSMAHEKEIAEGVPRQFKSPAEIRGYPKAIHQYGTRKRRQQDSSKILTDSPEKNNC